MVSLIRLNDNHHNSKKAKEIHLFAIDARWLELIQSVRLVLFNPLKCQRNYILTERDVFYFLSFENFEPAAP